MIDANGFKWLEITIAVDGTMLWVNGPDGMIARFYNVGEIVIVDNRAGKTPEFTLTDFSTELNSLLQKAIAAGIDAEDFCAVAEHALGTNGIGGYQ